MLFHHDHFYVEWSPRKDNRLPKTQPNHKILCQSKRNALKWPWPTLELWHTLFFFMAKPLNFVLIIIFFFFRLIFVLIMVRCGFARCHLNCLYDIEQLLLFSK